MDSVSQRDAVGSSTSQRMRRAQRALLLTITALGALTYSLVPGVQHEAAHALTSPVAGDGAEISNYLRSFGVWAPIASLGLMVLQAVAAPVPAVLITFANGLAFGVFWGGLLTIAGQTLAAAGLTGIRSGPFLLATAIGGSPQAFLYAYLIRSAPQYAAAPGSRHHACFRPGHGGCGAARSTARRKRVTSTPETSLCADTRKER